MSVPVRIKAARLTVAALYALAAVVLGFAHRSGAAAPVAAEVTVLLPGQARADLCSSGTPDPGPHRIGPVCDACRLAAAPGLPPPSGSAVLPPPGRAVLAGLAPSDGVAPRRGPPPAARGPPAASA